MFTRSTPRQTSPALSAYGSADHRLFQCLFDYAILKRPIYFYMYDIESYANELRGFYFDLYETLPGRIYTEEDLLLADIAGGVYEENRISAFHKRFHVHEDGWASKRVCDIVFKKEQTR